MPSHNEVGHAAAQSAIDAISRELIERNAGAAVAVVDSHGELVAFLRTDGCPLPSIDNAVNKAFTAAREGVESAALGDRARQEDFPVTNFGDLRYTGWGGGVPIVVDGEVIGGVGVSGLPEQTDIELAHKGVASIVGGR